MHPPSAVGDVHFPRKLRFPADDWGLPSVICGKRTFPMKNAVADDVSPKRPTVRPPSPHPALVRKLSMESMSCCMRPQRTMWVPVSS